MSDRQRRIQDLMLHEFIDTHRDQIIARARERLAARLPPSTPSVDLNRGVSLFLTQLGVILRAEMDDTAVSSTAMAESAVRHGRELLAAGFDVSHVVNDYGDICQAITQLALARGAPITVDEFRILNRCLDQAIAEAVTEHARLTAQARATEEIERLGHVAHEVRDMLNTAVLAFQILKQGRVAINGSTGAVLGRSLIGLRDFVDSILADVRLDARQQRNEEVAVAALVDGIAVAARMAAEYRAMQLVIAPIAEDLIVRVDEQLLSSAVVNLLNNAFKYSRANGTVALRAERRNGRVAIEVEDECGGFPDGIDDPFAAFGQQRGRDHSGLGLGLSIAMKAVKAQDGNIHIRNMPGRGCVFVIDLPLVAGTADRIDTETGELAVTTASAGDQDR